MLDFLNTQEKDALTLEKERLDKHLVSLQRQSQELERRLQRRFPQTKPESQKIEPKPERIARFIPDDEMPKQEILRTKTPSHSDLKHQKRITKNRVITMGVVAIILAILVIRTLF